MRRQISERELDRRIYETLLALGVPIRMLGYRYMEEALHIMVSDANAEYAITKLVYGTIADTYGTSPQQVESAIRTAAKSAWDKGNPEQHERIFGYSRGSGSRPCNSEYLLRVLAHVRYMI